MKVSRIEEVGLVFNAVKEHESLCQKCIKELMANKVGSNVLDLIVSALIGSEALEPSYDPCKLCGISGPNILKLGGKDADSMTSIPSFTKKQLQDTFDIENVPQELMRLMMSIDLALMVTDSARLALLATGVVYLKNSYLNWDHRNAIKGNTPLQTCIEVLKSADSMARMFAVKQGAKLPEGLPPAEED